MKTQTSNEKGSTLVMTIIVVASLLVLLGVAVDYTTQISRNTQRTRKTALAMEIADGHLEMLYTSWRNIYRTTWSTSQNTTGGTDYSLVGTNYFYTNCPSCSPAPVTSPAPVAIPGMNPAGTPPAIPLPASSNFPTEANYTVSQYRIQAVDPMVTLDGNGDALVEGDSSHKGTGGYVPMPKNSPPPAGFGPNPAYGYPGGFPYSLYYLASVDVKVPALKGDVTAKVRRVFEKKFDLPWTYALFFVDDLELHPTSPLTINGPIHTNGNLYISTSNLTIASPVYSVPTGSPGPFPTSGRVEYGGDYLNGYAPLDTAHTAAVTAPTFAKSSPSLTLSDCPPSLVAPFLPFGWNVKLTNADGSPNNDSYREIIEPPSGYPIPAAIPSDPLRGIRYYNQAGIKVLIDQNNNVRVFRPATTSTEDGTDASKIVECFSNSSNTNDQNIWKLIAGPNKALNTNLAMYDAREGCNVRIAELDVSKLTTVINQNGVTYNQGGTVIPAITGFNGVIYISDTTPVWNSSNPTVRNVVSSPMAKLGSTNGTSGGTDVSTSQRAIRLVNGWKLPTYGAYNGGLTVVSNNPIYIKGNYNTSDNSSSTPSWTQSPAGVPPSNVTTTSAPTYGSYARKPSAVIGDSINVLSGNWSDANSPQSITGGGYNVGNPRSATSTTINTALATGVVPTSSLGYSGGGEGLIRLQEDWRTQNFVYYGSMAQLYRSTIATAASSITGNFFKSPAATKWFYDYPTFSDAAPPGNLMIAAYLQQQRWYQVY